MRVIILLAVLLCVQAYLSAGYKYDGGNSEDEALERELVEKREAEEFFKRLFHPFSTKNEEIKRETREVYEEKCEHVIPTKRNCPDLKTWPAFKAYENGE